MSEPYWMAVVEKATGEWLEVLDSKDSCEPYRGNDYQGHCGGCGRCMLMQAEQSDSVELLSIGENFSRINLQFFADSLYRAFGDRALEMSDDLYTRIHRLWKEGVEYGRHGIPPVLEEVSPKAMRQALRDAHKRTTENP